MSKKIDSRLPNNIGAGELTTHAAIKTPWEKLISLYDAHNYICRHRAGVASVYMEVLRILIPDYNERCRRMCECAGQLFGALFDPEGDFKLANIKPYELNMHPFMRGTFLSGPNGDAGDESLWMCGRVNDLGSHRIEKELDSCPWELMGSEICRTSTWAGMEVIGNRLRDVSGGGPKMRITMYEALGCGDLHCRIVGESFERYPIPERDNSPDYIWENFGPIATEDRIKFTPEEKLLKDCQMYRDECDFKYCSGTCHEYDAGEGMVAGYEFAASSNLGCNYVTWTITDMLQKGEVTMEQLSALFENVFEGVGKMFFLDPWAIKGVRDWMGVPNEINDGRVMGAYIEVYLQAIKCKYDIIAFNKDEVIYDIDTARFDLQTFPTLKMAYIPMWFGMTKSLINYKWSLWEEEGAPEGMFRIKIARKIDKRSR